MDFNYQKHIARLVTLYLRDELGADEARELEEWRAVSVRHEEIFQRMISASHLEASVRRFVRSDAEQEAEWQLIRRRTQGIERKLIRKIFRYAALWILPLLIGGGIFYFIRPMEKAEEQNVVAFEPGGSHAILELGDGSRVDLGDSLRRMDVQGKGWQILQDSLKYQVEERSVTEEYHTLKVPRGGEYTLFLADGTKVFLNAESSLKYPVHFAGDLRKVKLKGEAYFEVKRDPVRPFIVDVNDLQVKVLGTSFGVRAYAEEENIWTTLVAGKVHVLTGGKEFNLNPSEQAVYHKGANAVKIASVDTELYVGWKDGRLVFDNCPLEQILRDLGRWYSFEVFYANQQAREIPFSLNVRKHEKFAQVLELMRNTGKVQFEINKNTVIVR